MHYSKITLVFLSVILFSSLFTSTNQAFAIPDTWTDATTTNVGVNDVNGISMSDANNGVAVGNGGQIIFTTNGGVDWTDATTTNVGATNMEAVSMSSTTNGVAVGSAGQIVFTTNGGVDWTDATTTNVGATTMRGVSMSSTTNGVAVGGGVGDIVFTTNGGVDWTDATTTNAGGNIIRAVSMSSDSNGVAVGNNGRIIFTTNGGVDWTVATTTNVGAATMLGVSMSGANNGVAVGDGGQIVYTTNGGVDWTDATTTNVGVNDMQAVSMSDATNGVAVGNGGEIVYTTNGGVDWTDATTTNVGLANMFAVSMSDTDNGVAGSQSGQIVFAKTTSDPVETVSSGGGGASKHNTKPSFGLDHKTHFQLIEGGFSFNGIPTDITHNYWTPFNQQSIKVGELNEFETKVFASQKLRVQEFLFGIPAVGESHKAELGVEVFYDHSGELEEIRVIQKTDIIDIDSIQIEKIKSKCRADSSDELCVTTQLQMKFLEPLQDNVMAMKAIDFKGRSNITYLNDGFDISGDSLNPMKTMMIPGTEKYEGLIEITQTAKYSDVWVASDGRAFEINEHGTPKLIHQTVEDKLETRTNLDRYHSEFTSYKEEQIDKAQKQLVILCEHCSDESFDKINDIFAYSYPITHLKIDDPKIKEILQSEELDAMQALEEMFEKRYPSKVFD